MKKDGNAIQLLKYIYLHQVPTRKLIRSIGYNYDWSGRVLKSLIDQNLVTETYIKDTKVLSLTKSGYNKIYELTKYDKEIANRIKSKMKGENGKYRQLKLSQTLSMINTYIPNQTDTMLEFEAKQLHNSNTTIPMRSEKIKIIQDEIEQRKNTNPHRRSFITLREIRELDKTNLQNIPSTRVHGLLHLETGNYAIYNHYKKRMKSYGDFESKFKDITESIIGEEIKSSIHFGLSYKILIDTITKTTSFTRMGYILTNMYYENQYFIPLTNEGVKQLELMTIPDYRNRLCEALISEQDRKRSENSVYDGITEQEDIIYLGFDCNYTAIEQLYENLNSIRIKSNAVIYCFSHQVKFYETIFKNRAELKILEIEQVIKYLK